MKQTNKNNKKHSNKQKTESKRKNIGIKTYINIHRHPIETGRTCKLKKSKQKQK